MSMETESKTGNVCVVGTPFPGSSDILTPDALRFIEQLERRFGATRLELLGKREQRQQTIDSGIFPDFLPETRHIREAEWTIGSIPQDLLDRRVEITGPAGDRKMVINALNSGAKVFMADFEDANSPTWVNTIQGQINLRDANRKTLKFINPEGKQYVLKDTVATLVVRPRGWHLEEKNVQLDGKAISASLFDFGLYLFHNASQLMENGSGPYFYLPKLESHLEARLWNDVFCFAQEELGIPYGTIKATVLIETIVAAFEMDEILYELKDHITGLNCGRWDYIFSYIKKFHKHPQFLVPDRSLVTMTVPFMRSYSLLTIQTCHRRHAFAIGGMAAQIPVKNNQAANEEAFQKVRLDKEREAKDGHDGTWVAHPGLVPVAMEVFDRLMPTPNQLHVVREDVHVTAEQLLEVPVGTITEKGFRTNVSVALQYIEAWLRGMGAVPIFNLMEDAATAEISRAQIWQWIRNPQAKLEDGREITFELYDRILAEELDTIKDLIGHKNFEQGQFNLAATLLTESSRSEEFVTFLTLEGYKHLN